MQWLTDHYLHGEDFNWSYDFLMQILDEPEEGSTSEAILTELCIGTADNTLAELAGQPEQYWHEFIERIAEDWGLDPEYVAAALAGDAWSVQGLASESDAPWSGFAAALSA